MQFHIALMTNVNNHVVDMCRRLLILIGREKGQMMNLPRLTPAEFEIMDVIWNGGEMTVTLVMNQVNTSYEKTLSRSTIQVQIHRLTEKGWLKCKGKGKTFLYSAAVKRSEASASIVEDVKKRVFGDSCTELVQTLLDHSSISSKDISDLKKLINQYSEGK
jgi:predicted transcriptional regulator